MAHSNKTISHTNRMGKIYYLHAAITKKGATRYVMKTKQMGALEAIPEGMEVVEGPNGEVSVRRIQAQEIYPLEIQTIESKLAAMGLRGYRVFAKGPHLTVYEPWRTAEALQDIADSLNVARMSEMDLLSRMFPGANPLLNALKESIAQAEPSLSSPNIDSMLDSSRVEPVLRFTLEDPEMRTFSVDRMNYRGDGGWHWLTGAMSLHKAAKTYLKHLGKESFYELV